MVPVDPEQDPDTSSTLASEFSLLSNDSSTLDEPASYEDALS